MAVSKNLITCGHGPCSNLLLQGVSPTIKKYCTKTCQQYSWRFIHKEQYALIVKDQNLSKYGITYKQYQQLLDQQGGRCASCNSEDPAGKGTFHVDHDHTCCDEQKSCGLCIRGLLCHGCNTAAGLLKEDPALVQALALYLSKTERWTP